MKKFTYKKAQSVLEYVIILTVVVTALIGAVTLLGLGGDNTIGLGALMKGASDKIEEQSGKILATVPAPN